MVRIGSAGWNIPRAHKARFPADGSQLQRYAARLNAAEINTSFYRPHAAATYERWAGSVPLEFRFAVKMPKVISHDRALLRSREPLERFLDEVAGLGSRLGVFLLQFPPSFAFEPRRVGRFFDVLRARTDIPVACEPRHVSWTTEAATRLLVKFRVARVAADPPRASGLDAPGGWPGLVYYRWHGSPRPYFSCYTAEQLDALARQLRAAGPGPPASERVGESEGRSGEVERTSVASEPRERRAPAKRRASERVGESEGRSPLDTIWCIFDNTGSGSAAANALDLKERVTG